MLDLGFTCLCVYEDQCVIEAEQPAFMQGIREVIGLIPDPWCRHFGHLHPLRSVPRKLPTHSPEFLDAVGRSSEASEGFLGGFMGLLESIGRGVEAPDRQK